MQCAAASTFNAVSAERGSSETDQRIQLRIGINTGDVIVDERDIYGNSINIAARLEGLAEPGQIYVTRGVRDQLLGHPDLLFENRGEWRVKNIDRPIRVFRVEYDLEARPKSASWGLTALAARFVRISFSLNPAFYFSDRRRAPRHICHSRHGRSDGMV